MCMYKPEKSISRVGDRVIVLTDNDRGFAFGTYTGNSRPESESYEISTIDALTGDTVDTSFYHKEDIFKSTKENLERVRDIVQ